MLTQFDARSSLRGDGMLRFFAVAATLVLFSCDRSTGHAQEQLDLREKLRLIRPDNRRPKSDLLDTAETEPATQDALAKLQVQETLEKYSFGADILELTQPSPDDSRLLALEKERCRTAFQISRIRQGRWLDGTDNIRAFLTASTRVGNALLALELDPSARKSILEKNLEIAKGREAYEKSRLEAGAGGQSPYLQAKYERLDAEIRLEELSPQKPRRNIVALHGDNIHQVIQASPDDDRLLALKKERCRTAMQSMTTTQKYYFKRVETLDIMLRASTRVTRSLLSLDPDPKLRVLILKHNLEIAKRLESYAKVASVPGEYASTKHERADAEILLEEAKRQLSR